jgi:rhamnosyl/mannosyltransferase
LLNSLAEGISAVVGPRAEALRVVHLGKYYPPARGGIEQQTRYLAQGLSQWGCQVVVVVVNHRQGCGKDVTYRSWAVTPDCQEWDGPVQVYRVGRCFHALRTDLCLGLPRLLGHLQRTFRPHLWHLHTPNITMLAALLMRPGLSPLIITHHSDIIRQRMGKYLVRPVEAQVYRRAQAVVATSAAYAAGSPLLQRFRAKVTVVPLGIDGTVFRAPSPQVLETAEQWRRRFGQPLWLCVGRMTPYKGFDVAITALREVPGQLLLLGSGPEEKRWRLLAERLGVRQRVHFLGAVEESVLAAAYHAATALWLPSRNRAEAFGLVQVEAMAAGCPVINTAIAHSGVPWVCRHEQEGLTVPPNDPAALAVAARRLWQEPGLRQRLAVAARQRAAEFDDRRMCQRYLAVYHHVLATHRPTPQPSTER